MDMVDDPTPRAALSAGPYSQELEADRSASRFRRHQARSDAPPFFIFHFPFFISLLRLDLPCEFQPVCEGRREKPGRNRRPEGQQQRGCDDRPWR